MKEIVKRRWLTDNDNQKIAPKTTIDQILMEDGSRFENEWKKVQDQIHTVIIQQEEPSHITGLLWYDLFEKKLKIYVDSKGWQSI